MLAPAAASDRELIGDEPGGDGQTDVVDEAQLRALAGDPVRRRRMGLGARLLAEEVFDRDKLAAEYLAVLLRPRSGRKKEQA